MANTMTKKLETARSNVHRLEVLSQIYDAIEERMKWDCMEATDEKDENGNRIFKSYMSYKDLEPFTYEYDKARAEKVWREVLSAVEKLADK